MSSKRPKLAYHQRTTSSNNNKEETSSVIEYEYTGRDHHVPNNVTHVRISSGITKIEDYSFCNKLHLKEVVLNEGLTVIGTNAFRNCMALEHINFPEEFLFETMAKLKKGGVLSISLPTDPGLLFRVGRLYLKLFSIKKKYMITSEKFDYMNATEHVNSIFGLHSIIKYNFGKSSKETYLPFRIKSFDLNLFYNVHIIKKD